MRAAPIVPAPDASIGDRRFCSRSTGAPLRPMGSADLLTAAAYGSVHLVVDAISVACVFACISVGTLGPPVQFAIVLAYDAVAFGSQALLGLVVDRMRAPAVAGGSGLLALAAAIKAASVDPILTLVLAGFGNALFHVGAGAVVLRAPTRRATAAGVFVAPGAIGLALGMAMGKAAVVPRTVFFVALGLGLVIMLVDRMRRAAPGQIVDALPSDRSTFGGLRRRDAAVVLALLFISIMIRSFVGFGCAFSAPRAAAYALPVAVFAGKLAGGFLADRIGAIRAGVGGLLAGAPLIAFSGSAGTFLVTGLVLFNLTMPVTLDATARVLRHRPATAFGLPCLALLAGALPSFFPVGQAWFGDRPFLALVVGSAIALYAALGMLDAAERGTRP